MKPYRSPGAIGLLAVPLLSIGEIRDDHPWRLQYHNHQRRRLYATRLFKRRKNRSISMQRFREKSRADASRDLHLLVERHFEKILNDLRAEQQLAERNARAYCVESARQVMLAILGEEPELLSSTIAKRVEERLHLLPRQHSWNIAVHPANPHLAVYQKLIQSQAKSGPSLEGRLRLDASQSIFGVRIELCTGSINFDLPMEISSNE